MNKLEKLSALAVKLSTATGIDYWNYSVDEATCCICGKSGRSGRGSELTSIVFTHRTSDGLLNWQDDQGSDQVENIGSDCLKQVKKLMKEGSK